MNSGTRVSMVESARPVVSVIMASYNHDSFIAESMSSVLGQTLSDLELIVIDDASKDRSRDIIREAAIRDHRVKPVYHRKNRGIAQTFNDGLCRARGTHLAVTASDDVWMKDKLERQVEVLLRDPSRIAWTEAVLIDEHGKSTGELFTVVKEIRGRTRNGWIYDDLVQGNYVPAQSLLFHRDVMGNIRFDERYKYLNDYKFVLDLAWTHDFIYLPQALVKYRIHDGNTINRDEKSWREDMVGFGKQILKENGQGLSRSSRAHLWMMMAAAHSKLGQRESARECLKQASFIKPCTPGLPRAVASFIKDGLLSLFESKHNNLKEKTRFEQ